MGDLSAHFSSDEFACPCCGWEAAETELIAVLEDVRRQFGRAVVVSSGCRCPDHNAAIGGAMSSRHLDGTAADIVIAGVPASVVADYLEREYPHRYGIGRYATWTHIDTRLNAARWARS